MREAPAVDVALFLAAVPAVARGHREQRLQVAREVRDVDAEAGDALVQAVTVVLQQLGADQRGGGDFAVVRGREDAVAGFCAVEHEAAAGDGGRDAVVDLFTAVEQQRECGPGVFVEIVVVGGRFVFGRAQHRGDRLCDIECMRRVRGLFRALALQARERVADQRRDAGARRFEPVFDGLGHWVARDPRARHLRDGVEQQPTRAVDAARVVERDRPGLETMPQVAAHTLHAGRHERLATELLQQLEHHALDRVGGAESRMQLRVALREPQPEAIGRTAERAEVVGVE